MGRLYCWRCGAPVAPDELACPGCGGTSFDARETRPRRPPLEVPFLLPYPWDLLERWPPSSVVSLSGPPGAGKSTLACLLRPDLWATSEQTPAQAAATLDRVLGSGRPAIPVWATVTPDDVHAALDALPQGLLIVDSLTAFGLQGALEVLHAVRDWAHHRSGRRALVIQQVTKDLRAAGLQELQHLVDAVAHVEQADEVRRLVVTKNRAGGLGSRLWRFAGDGTVGPVQRRWRCSFSVEGEGGRYRLHPYPLPGAKWAGPLAALDARGSLQPGLACAALPVRGYPDDALEPLDVEERRAFAEGQGLTWITMAEALESASQEDVDDGAHP